jgi:hypothetical protein
MSDQPTEGDAGRLVTCQACGNRTARSAWRCPACGALRPTGAGAPARPVEPPPARATRGRHPWGSFAALAGAALVGAAVSATVFALRPVAPPPASERRAEPPAPIVASPPAAPPPHAIPEPSRSRGRADWLFFFTAGDQLVRMSDEAPIGMVIRTVPRHVFPDGTVGPAYLVQAPAGGGQRFVDADELERGGRLQ